MCEECDHKSLRPGESGSTALPLTFPLTLLTFGLFLLVVNALMLWLVATLVPGMRIQGFTPALLGSLLLTLLNLAVAALIGPGWAAA